MRLSNVCSFRFDRTQRSNEDLTIMINGRATQSRLSSSNNAMSLLRIFVTGADDYTVLGLTIEESASSIRLRTSATSANMGAMIPMLGVIVSYFQEQSAFRVNLRITSFTRR